MFTESYRDVIKSKKSKNHMNNMNTLAHRRLSAAWHTDPKNREISLSFYIWIYQTSVAQALTKLHS